MEIKVPANFRSTGMNVTIIPPTYEDINRDIEISQTQDKEVEVKNIRVDPYRLFERYLSGPRNLVPDRVVGLLADERFKDFPEYKMRFDDEDYFMYYNPAAIEKGAGASKTTIELGGEYSGMILKKYAMNADFNYPLSFYTQQSAEILSSKVSQYMPKVYEIGLDYAIVEKVNVIGDDFFEKYQDDFESDDNFYDFAYKIKSSFESADIFDLTRGDNIGYRGTMNTTDEFGETRYSLSDRPLNIDAGSIALNAESIPDYQKENHKIMLEAYVKRMIRQLAIEKEVNTLSEFNEFLKEDAAEFTSHALGKNAFTSEEDIYQRWQHLKENIYTGNFYNDLIDKKKNKFMKQSIRTFEEQELVRKSINEELESIANEIQQRDINIMARARGNLRTDFFQEQQIQRVNLEKEESKLPPLHNIEKVAQTKPSIANNIKYNAYIELIRRYIARSTVNVKYKGVENIINPANNEFLQQTINDHVAEVMDFYINALSSKLMFVGGQL